MVEIVGIKYVDIYLHDLKYECVCVRVCMCVCVCSVQSMSVPHPSRYHVHRVHEFQLVSFEYNKLRIMVLHSIQSRYILLKLGVQIELSGNVHLDIDSVVSSDVGRSDIVIKVLVSRS